jgi:hypothetical protein
MESCFKTTEKEAPDEDFFSTIKEKIINLTTKENPRAIDGSAADILCGQQLEIQVSQEWWKCGFPRGDHQLQDVLARRGKQVELGNDRWVCQSEQDAIQQIHHS